MNNNESNLSNEGSDDESQRELEITFDEVVLGFHWTWGYKGEQCSICQTSYDAAPPQLKNPTEDFVLGYGRCGHKFHLHCIDDWLKEQNKCPICRREWEFETSSMQSKEDALDDKKS